MVHVEDHRGHDPHSLLRTVLHIIGTTDDTRRCVSLLLNLAREATGATGCALISSGGRVVQSGGGQDWAGQYAHLLAGHELPPGIQVNPQLPQGTRPPGAAWLAAPISAGSDTFGTVYLSFDRPPHVDRETTGRLETLLEGIAIVAKNVMRERRTAQTQRLLEFSLDRVSDPVLIVDHDRRVRYLNPAGETLFNTPARKAYGRPVSDVVQIDKLLQLLAEPSDEVDKWAADSRLIFAPVVAEIKDERGAAGGTLLILKDVTRYEELTHNQNEFMRIVSHDLRTPLTSMKGFASILDTGGAGVLNDKQHHYIQRILSGIEQITDIVDNIQDAGRYDPETGFYEMSCKPCDLDVLLRHIAGIYFPRADKQLTVSLSTANDVPIISVDEKMLERAISNLVDNAVKYTPDGGNIELLLYRREGDVIIAVRDDGPGISPEDQKRLFDRHVRIIRKQHFHVKGSGLGLFIVRSVAQRHGGDAWVESAEGEGSTFYLSIPLEDANRLA